MAAVASGEVANEAACTTNCLTLKGSDMKGIWMEPGICDDIGDSIMKSVCIDDENQSAK